MEWPNDRGRVMAHAVPSQVCNLIVKIFPDVGTEQAEKGQHANRRATDVRPVLDLLERIPDELIRLSAEGDARRGALARRFEQPADGKLNTPPGRFTKTARGSDTPTVKPNSVGT